LGARPSILARVNALNPTGGTQVFFFVANFRHLATPKKWGFEYTKVFFGKKGSKSPYFEEKQV
jgi:hypothetical protein